MRSVRSLRYYIQDDTQALWRLADPVVRGLPDQGIEQAPERGTKRKSAEGADEGKDGTGGRKKGAEDDKAPILKKCLVCGKRHLPLCPLPPNFRQEQRAKRKAARETEKQRKDKDPGEAKPKGAAKPK